MYNYNGKLLFSISYFWCCAQWCMSKECNNFAYVTPILRNQSHCQCAFTSYFDNYKYVDCGCYNLPDTQLNVTKYKIQLYGVNFYDDYTKGLQCLPLIGLWFAGENAYNNDKMSIEVKYEYGTNFFYESTFVIIEVPLQSNNFGVIQNNTFIPIDKFVPLIKNVGNIWEPDMPKNYELKNLTIIGNYQDSQKQSWTGRNSTTDVMKQWNKDRLKDVTYLKMSYVRLDYFIADDIACMPELFRLIITDSSLNFFSGFSVSNPYLNTMAIYDSTFNETYAEYGINQTEIQNKLIDIGIKLFTTQHDIWNWKCSASSMLNLVHIDISSNNLTEHSIYINASEFKYLDTINLANNNFKTITKIFYSNGKSTNHLKELNLARNKIKNLDNIEQLAYYETLDLSYNLISSWENNKTTYSNIRILNLSYNHITVMSEEMLKSLFNFHRVDLGGNPIDCKNPQLKLFHTWLKNYSYMIKNLGNEYQYKPLTCNGIDIRYLDFNKKYGNLNYYVISLSIILLLMSFIPIVFLIKYRFQLVYMWQLLRIRRDARKNRLEKKSRDWKYDAFVSYNFMDRQWVHDQLVNNLENDEEKYALCLHERDFQLGRYIMQNVAECMESSRHVIVVLSPNFVQSNWCQWELKLVQQLMFENTSDFLILVELERLDRKTLPSTLRLLMSTKTYLEWPSEGNLDHFWKRLKDTLGSPLAILLPKSCDDVFSEACGDHENLIA